MRNRIALGVALAAVVLSGCQKEPTTSTVPPSSSASSAPSEGPAQTAPGKLTRAEVFTQTLPQGVVLDFPYHARSVKTVQSKKTGNESQQFLLEYLGTDTKSAASAVGADMTRAGFTMASKKKKKNGYNLSFTKDGYGKAKVYVRKKSQKKLRHADAKGMIKLSFPVPATADQQPVSAP